MGKSSINRISMCLNRNAFVQPTIAQTYFSDPDNRSRADIESSFASLRGTMKSLQVCSLLFWSVVFGLDFSQVVTVPNIQRLRSRFAWFTRSSPALFLSSDIFERETCGHAGYYHPIILRHPAFNLAPRLTRTPSPLIVSWSTSRVYFCASQNLSWTQIIPR